MGSNFQDHLTSLSPPEARADGVARADASNFLRSLRGLDRWVTKTIRRHQLIGEGDAVMVALSGGKDSLTLLNLLSARLRWQKERYSLVACHIRGGLGCAGGCASTGRLQAECDSLGVPLRIVTGAMPTAREIRDNKSPCFVCSWHRRKALFSAADQMGIKTVAFGHHRDDVAQTLLLNLLWKGRHETMLPRQVMFGGRITIIRPLVNVDEAEIVRLAHMGNLPVRPCTCRFASRSRREQVAQLIDQLREAGCSDVTGNLVRSAYAGVTPGEDGHPPRRRPRENSE